MQPEADELVRRIREGRPLGDLGQELSQTPPSPANIVVSVVDRDESAVATDVFDILTEGGFNTSPGVVDLTQIQPPTKGAMILYRPDAEYGGQGRRDLLRQPRRSSRRRPGTLPKGQDVAVVVERALRDPAAEHRRARGVPDLGPALGRCSTRSPGGRNVTADDTTHELITSEELARLRRIEVAATELLDQMQGRRSATTVLTAVAELRAALRETQAP